MPTISLKAHYDGTQIVLDEKFDLPANAALIVTVLPAESDREYSERAEWATLSASALARAYGDDEPEYNLEDIR